MQKVLGFGGLFFRAMNPAALAAWYQTHLGIDPVPNDDGAKPWTQEAGPTVFAPFADDTKYIPAGKSFMFNFRVADLDKMVEQLVVKGISVDVDPEPDPQGRFARLRDPEGNAIELWEEA